jgi:hypothetical protein
LSNAEPGNTAAVEATADLSPEGKVKSEDGANNEGNGKAGSIRSSGSGKTVEAAAAEDRADREHRQRRAGDQQGDTKDRANNKNEAAESAP